MNKDSALTSVVVLHYVCAIVNCRMSNYRFIKSSNAWQKRKQERDSQTIGRMYAVSPKDLEQYFLRLLLLHTPGAISFEDLRTVDNVTAQTYQEAAVKRGLVESNDQWIQTMQEAEHTAMPYAIRTLFVTILIYGKIPLPHAQELWKKFQPAMCEDFSHRHGPEKALYLGYMDVNKRLEAFQSSLSLTYCIPEPLKPLDVVEEVMNKAEELQMGNDMLSSLNDEQRQVADRILESARSDDPQNCFSSTHQVEPAKLISFLTWLIV